MLGGVLLGMPSGFVLAAQVDKSIVFEEDRIISSKALVTIDVGKSRRIVQISPDGERMHVQLKIDVDVSAVFLSYHRHAVLDGWYDRKGLVAFVSEMNENGKITQLNGRRVERIGGRVFMHLYGVVAGKPLDREIPYSMIHYTDLENYPYVAALSREQATWRVLNLFNGEIELVKVEPVGTCPCPEYKEATCYRLNLSSPERQGSYYYLPEGQIAYVKGEDSLGSFMLRMPEELMDKKEKTKTAGGLFNSFFGPPAEAVQNPPAATEK